jgi:rsbT co-antagonist protein RsbR
MADHASILPKIVEKHQHAILDDWTRLQALAGVGSGRLSEAELRNRSSGLLAAIRLAMQSGKLDSTTGGEWRPCRDQLEELSAEWARLGLNPSETATFVLSLKQPLFEILRTEAGQSAAQLADEVWITTRLIDELALFSADAFLKVREAVIVRQRQDLLELSTPVVKLWDGVLALPVIGTLDSDRTQTVMETLLQTIVETGAEIAIIDITGVPTVDTQVAQHLIKTVSAARLMGADCIISGIRPQIAQTIVHLGLELDVVSKSTMADAFELALRRVGLGVTRRAKPEAAESAQP